MINYALGTFGIVISVLLFLIGYRQTVGAKKERVTAANTELEKTLMRRIVLEKFTPSLIDLSRLIEGKARDYRVQPGELLSESQTLNTIFTRVMESDLIPAEQRELIMERIVPVLSASETEPTEENAAEQAASSDRLRRTRESSIAALALLASLLGSLVVVIPKVKHLGSEISGVLPLVGLTVLASLTAITLTYLGSRLRAGPDESSSKASEVSGYIEFEGRVRKLLEEFGTVMQSSAEDPGFDFLLETSREKILIEVKGWSWPMPSAILGVVAARLRDAAKRTGATDSIIVTKVPIHATRSFVRVSDGEVKLMTLPELRRYLAHK